MATAAPLLVRNKQGIKFMKDHRIFFQVIEIIVLVVFDAWLILQIMPPLSTVLKILGWILGIAIFVFMVLMNNSDDPFNNDKPPLRP